MAMSETMRVTPAAAEAAPGPVAWRSGEGAEDRLIAQVAFAMAAESGRPAAPTPETREALRGQAIAALSDFAFRYLHNRVEEIRREAAAEAAARPPRGGFLRLVLANLVALALAGGAWALLASQPDLLARLTGH